MDHPQPLSLLTIHAHPDDEASKGAPTVAKYHAEGVHTVLVCCTGGEEGELQNPSLRDPGQPFHGLDAAQEKALLTAMRPGELARSAEIIGFDVVEMLGYRDSGMPDSDANLHPDSFHMATLDESVGRLVAIVRRERPQVIITYADDQRGYLHPDHLKVHDISGPAFDRAGDPAWYPELGEPWQPQKLYYTMWSKARLMAVHEGMIHHRGESPFEQDWLDRPGHDDRITSRIEVGSFLWPEVVRCAPMQRRSTRMRSGGSVSPTTSSRRCIRGRTGFWPGRWWVSPRKASWSLTSLLGCEPRPRCRSDPPVPGGLRQERRGGRWS